MSAPSREAREALFELFFEGSASSPYVLAVSSTAFAAPLAGDSAGTDAWERLRGLLSIALDIGRDRPVYYDALAFRHQDRGIIKEDPRPLWEAASDVVLVTNTRVAERVRGSGMFGERRVHLVEVPEREAIGTVQETVHAVESLFRVQDLVPRRVPIIVGAGVAGKLVVRALMQHHTVFDIGAYLGPKHPEGRRGGAWRPEDEREGDGRQGEARA